MSYARYFKDFWNIVDWLSIIIGFGVVFYWGYLMYMSDGLALKLTSPLLEKFRGVVKNETKHS